MIGYVTVGTNDLARAVAFYDALFAPLGAKRFFENARLRLWSTGRGSPAFGVIAPFDGETATAGNGAMTALPVGSRARVEAMHALALELGARDEGGPGERAGGVYGAYCRDPDGNKVMFFHLG